MSENHHRLPLVLNLAPYLAPESFGWRYFLPFAPEHSLFCPGFKVGIYHYRIHIFSFFPGGKKPMEAFPSFLLRGKPHAFTARARVASAEVLATFRGLLDRSKEVPPEPAAEAAAAAEPAASS